MNNRCDWNKSSKWNFPDVFNDGFLRPEQHILFGSEKSNCNNINLDDDVCVSNILMADTETMNEIIERIRDVVENSEINDNDYFLMTLWKDEKSDYMLLATFGCFSPEENYLNELSVNIDYTDLGSKVYFLCDDVDNFKGPEKALSRLNDDYSLFLSEDYYVKVRDLLLDSITIEKLEYLNGYYDIGNKLQEKFSQKEKEIILEQINTEDKNIIKKRI